MAKRRNGMLIVALTTLFALSVVVPVGARAFGRGGGGPGFGGRAGGLGGLLERLLNPCRSDCRDTADDCSAAADSAALTCIDGACAAEVTTAQSACATERRSPDCRDAISALRECAATCLDTRTTAVTACHAALGDCLDACDSAQ